MVNWRALKGLMDKVRVSPTRQIKMMLIMEPRVARSWFYPLLSDVSFKLQHRYNTGKEMMAKLSADTLPDVVLIDVKNCDTAAIETIAWLHDQHPSIKVFAFCNIENEPLIKHALHSGAVSYILKPADRAQIQDIIWEVYTKGFYVPYWKQNQQSACI